jgi:hypothetical protein
MPIFNMKIIIGGIYMVFDAEIIKSVTQDPYFKVVFSYETDNLKIDRGFAEIIRKAPIPLITYDKLSADILINEDKTKLNLELLNTVINYLFSSKISRTHKGNVVLHIA